ncbi:hypothetical protein J6590_014537 [Homalodisca vitripennis]|nr:hypothetical protein J6590_014537 [Homalodisca vitripennis]
MQRYSPWFPDIEYKIKSFNCYFGLGENFQVRLRSCGLPWIMEPSGVLYIYESVLYCRYKCEVTRGRDVYEYNTRGRVAFRSAQHRLQTYEALPSEVGAKLFNKLPLDLRVENRKPLYKRKLRRLLVQGAYTACW